MKTLILITLFVSSIFAKGPFEHNKQYTCLNTHTFQHGQRFNIDPKEANEQLFVFTIKGRTLTTDDNMIFKYKGKTGKTATYKNKDFSLILTPTMQMSLSPKQAQGSVQYYFSCK
mgnify:FL=1